MAIALQWGSGYVVPCQVGEILGKSRSSDPQVQAFNIGRGATLIRYTSLVNVLRKPFYRVIVVTDSARPPAQPPAKLAPVAETFISILHALAQKPGYRSRYAFTKAPCLTIRKCGGKEGMGKWTDVNQGLEDEFGKTFGCYRLGAYLNIKANTMTGCNIYLESKIKHEKVDLELNAVRNAVRGVGHEIRMCNSWHEQACPMGEFTAFDAFSLELPVLVIIKWQDGGRLEPSPGVEVAPRIRWKRKRRCAINEGNVTTSKLNLARCKTLQTAIFTALLKSAPRSIFGASAPLAVPTSYIFYLSFFKCKYNTNAAKSDTTDSTRLNIYAMMYLGPSGSKGGILLGASGYVGHSGTRNLETSICPWKHEEDRECIAKKRRLKEMTKANKRITAQAVAAARDQLRCLATCLPEAPVRPSIEDYPSLGNFPIGNNQPEVRWSNNFGINPFSAAPPASDKWLKELPLISPKRFRKTRGFRRTQWTTLTKIIYA
ncbi:uncharacterized protein BDR25DRAFT_354192 [Lindgomyces ingoldianus]|uniref:Uncharacterized protein n=1 Tax=Lindgomyces ingoldianus TaxID=673940 RepID=A0ACB6R044_9PLEO|nr:uncharacterized protein BDR25DRAFT_354192 [Lindgomyces ingoldianus]KAF2471695.1 hypothetical protein BDR25DRAFT_354192 [Lindgomyces ingoldianus]